MTKLLLLALTCATTLHAVRAQTGRIAHLSHGGSMGVLAAAAKSQDNFGEVYHYFIADSVRYVSATRLLCYGRRDSPRYPGTTDTLHLPEAMTTAAAYRYLRENRYLLRRDNKPVKFIGFDSVSVPAQGTVPQRVPSRKQRHRRKQAVSGALPVMPRGTGGAMLLATLAVAGWLLAGRRSVATA